MRRWLNASVPAASRVADHSSLWLPGALAWMMTVGWIALIVGVARPPSDADLTFFGARIFTSGAWPWNGVALVVAVALLVAVLRASGGRGAAPADPTAGQAPVAPLAGLLVLGALTLGLTSQAVGQWLPLLPAAVVAVLAGLERSAPRPLARGIAVALIALSCFQVASASRVDDGLSRLRLVNAGPLGRLPVTDTRTLLEDQ
ncbi:MAG TPA: hypothetical protein VMV01_04915, partial [Planctomycetota bacterium]|nr:hypothetical protein [Planctomycetota bacterium]